jgi:aryl-alcohol dehydrogenase-like predicted oxidoreductase
MENSCVPFYNMPPGGKMKTNKVELRSLGKTDIKVTPIGLGTMQLSGGSGSGVVGMGFHNLTAEQKNTIVKAALDGGINYFDTAEMYGGGVSERALAAGLKAAGVKDKDVVIETKWNPLLRTAKNMRHTIDTRLSNLDGFTISNFMIHNPHSFSSPEAEMEILAELVRAGKIRSAGVTNFDEAHMRRAHAALAKHGLPLALNQVQYSLLHRDIERNGVLQAAKELGVTIVAYTPLGYGLLTGRYHRDKNALQQASFYRRPGLRSQIERIRPLIDAMDKIARRHDASLAQVALNWLIYFNGDCVVTIPGASRASQVEEAAGAMRFQLSDVEHHQLEQLSRGL